ncbi:hypothetical protein ESOMN_v1c05930 [Williamsoniiplasma somnilux]|uniref:KTSC domain-containing protein n=1 Tax=Williamsoniiplasma somnilux TaxID=215578 RepID=A0A2K8NYT6_9MOLU|nr:KTSC domain-containing protein [Williamsoniiplasma somnilux]ATZ18975.1 hypothetical protein ESOMN_v1c05930 [Williamsoniiplasma somnilux]
MKTNINWIETNSSAIKKIGFESNISHLYIVFQLNEKDYEFCLKGIDTYYAFLKSSSKGSFFNSEIKNNKQYNLDNCSHKNSEGEPND